MTLDSLFTKITPITYWILAILWGYISLFYIIRIHKKNKKTRIFNTLFIILALDAFRTLIESLFFGLKHSYLNGFFNLDHTSFILEPKITFLPKLMNIVVAITIIVLLIKKWVPEEEKEIVQFKSQIDEQNKIMDQVPVCIMITDLENKITYVNNRICSLTGYTKAELIGQSPSILNSGANSVTDYKELWETLKADREWHGQFLNKKKNGDLYWEKAIISSIYDSEGNKDHYLSITEDITEKVQIQKEKRLLQEELNQSQRLKSVGQLVGGIAHDFNNELSGIMSAAQILNNPKRVDDEVSRKFVNIILKSAKRSSELIRNLLTFCKKRDNDFTKISIADVVNDTIAILSPTISRYIKIKLITNYENDKVMANFSEIHSTLINLGINASHAIDNIGTITFSISNTTINNGKIQTDNNSLKSGLYCKIDITDTGSGIPKDVIDKIFDPFFTTKGKELGTGLGLSSSKRIIEYHKGKIDVTTGENGTTFSILLPTFVA